MNSKSFIVDNCDNFDYFKLAFFGSSSFVLPILEDILQNQNQSLIQAGIKQLKNLLENQKNELNELKKTQDQQILASNSDNLDVQIKPIWWKNQDFLAILEFILKLILEINLDENFELNLEQKEKEIINSNYLNSDLITNTDLIKDNFGQKMENSIQQFKQITNKNEFKSSKDSQNLGEIQKLQNLELQNYSQNSIQNQDKINQKINQSKQKINTQINTKYSKEMPLFLQNNPKTCELILELAKKIKLELVITQPDKLNGKKIIENPISQFAKSHNLQLEMPIKINSEIEEIKQKYQLDCAIVASFGQILNSKVLNFPKFIINWHPSLLPKYRGATPIQTALLENQKISGLSWIKMTKGMDSGPIWIQIPQIIQKSDTFETFTDSMGKLGSQTWALPIIANLIEKMNEL